MPSERVQRRIDTLLDEAEEAISAGDWGRVRTLCDSVLRLDADNVDARTYLEASEQDTGIATTHAEALEGRTSPNADDPVRAYGHTAPGGASTAPTRPVDPTPTSFANGRYTVSDFLGEGGKKRVFLAHDTLLDREVAFALIKTEGFDETSRSRVTREAQAMGRLGTHPNIVTVFDLGVEGSEPYMVTELMGGGDVEGLLEGSVGSPLPAGEGEGEGEGSSSNTGPSKASGHGGLTLERTIKIGKAVCEGLEFAHSRDIVHRDLKPGNVWLTEDGTAKIGDFGLAMMTDRSRLTREAMMIGTVSYMPPEQATGGDITPKADLYSLGAMLYEMVTGRPPFLGDDEIAIIGQHINTAPVAPTWHSSHCPRPLEAVIMRLLAKDPAERPDSAQDVFNALDAIDLTARGESVEQDATSLESLAGGVFVGRQAEMDQLKAALEDVLGGSGRLLTLVGEPGIGKTRTSEELATYAGLRGAQVLWGRCYETGGQPPYWPWVQAIRGYVRETDPDELRRQMGSSASVVAEIITDVKDRLPDIQPPPEMADPDSARFRLFDSIASFLKSASQAQPLVIVLDDLHWSDRPSLTFLEFMARELNQSRVLLICTYRDMELNRRHPLTVTLGDLSRERLFERVLLRGLTEQDIGRFIEIAAGFTAPSELPATVHRHTEGNPLFVTEVVRELVQSGELAENRVSGRSTWSVRIPEGVREVIGRRLDRLSERANEILTTAAVVGRDFHLDALKALAEDTTEGQLLDVLDEALDAKIIEELSDGIGHYQFTHALMQETLSEELSLTRRVRLHARIAETLERLYGDTADDHAAELAHHYAEAETLLGTDRVVAYSLAAGRNAAKAYGFEEAARHFERGLEAQETNDRTTADLNLGLASALMYTLGRSEIQRAADALITAFDHYESADLPVAPVIDAMVQFPLLIIQGTSGLVDLFERARSLAEPGSGRYVDLTLALSNWCKFESYDNVRSLALANEALDLARTLGDEPGELRALMMTTTGMGSYLADPDDAGRMAQLLNSNDDAITGQNVCKILGSEIAWRQEDLPGSIQWFEKSLEWGKQSRNKWAVASGAADLAMVQVMSGKFEEAMDAVEVGEAASEGESRVLASAMLAQCFTGDLAKAHEYAVRGSDGWRSLVKAGSQVGARWGFLVSVEESWLINDNMIDAELLELGEAWTEMDDESGDRWDREHALAIAHNFLGVAAVIRDDRGKSESHYESASKLPVPAQHISSAGWLATPALAYMAAHLGRYSEADAHFKTALETANRWPSPTLRAFTLTLYAEMILDRSADDPSSTSGIADHEKAIKLQDEALAITQELGMRPLTERILARREILRA